MTKCVFYSATYPYCRKACRGVILDPWHYRHPHLTFPENLIQRLQMTGERTSSQTPSK